MAEIKAILARNMKAARERLGYSQAKLAELAGTSVAFIGEIEIERKSPSLENVGNIAEALNMQVFQLFLEDGQREIEDRQSLFTSLKNELETKIKKDIETTVRKYQKT
jgi:transcriptional regulator with XRE-family HTH domain